MWAVAFVIACVYVPKLFILDVKFTCHFSIPFFNDLLGVVSATFATWYTYGISVSAVCFRSLGVTTERHLSGSILVSPQQEGNMVFNVDVQTESSFLGLYNCGKSIDVSDLCQS